MQEECKMNLFRTVRVSALAFAYLMTGITPAMADDSEIYFGGVSGGSSGGSPNVLLLLDTSGSMLFPMYNTYPTGHPSAGATVPKADCADGIGQTLNCAANEDDRRSRHLANAVKRILESLDGNIRVGIGRYNSNSSGGRIIYGARPLDERTSTGSTEDRTYRVAASNADAHQLGSSGTAIVTNASPLPLGDETSASYNASPSSNQTQSGTSSTVSTSTTVPLGGYSTTSPSNIGAKFTGLNIPQGATIASASLVLTHCGNTCSFSGGPSGTDNGAFKIAVAFQNTNSPGNYGTSGSATDGRVTSTGRTYQTATTVDIASSELVSTNASKNIDVTTQVQAFVNGTGWGTGSNLAIKISPAVTSPAYAYTTATKNGRLITRPSLLITYNTINVPTYTGVRFSSVDIPQGATINSAFLDFTAAQSDSGSAQWEIKVDPAAIAEAFPSSASSTSVNHLDGTRWNSGASVTRSPGNWVSGQTYSLDVKSLVQTNVSQSSYCGGSAALAFRIRQTGTYSAANTNTRRYATSYDGNASKAPVLRVNYTLPTGSTCLVASRSSTVRSSSDDGEDTGSTQKLDAGSAALKATTTTGLRFSSLSVPQGATVRSVTLKLRAANTPGSTYRGTFSVRGFKIPDIATFASTNRISSISSNGTTATVTLTPGSTWTKGTANEFTESFTGTGKSTTGLTGIVQEIVDQGSWVRGAALALALKGSITPSPSSLGCNDNRFPCLYQADTGAYSAASITVSYESADPNDGIRTVRQDLQDLVATMMGTYYGGGTPMGEALYEAGRYMMGKSADYGKASVYTDAASSQNGADTYVSPVDGGECQSNNIVFLTDGAPSNDSDNKKLDSTAASCTDSWTCMKSAAGFMKETGFTHGGKKSNITTYMIGFGPDVADTNSVAYKGMGEVAAAGGGQFFPADDADALVVSFETIFSRLTDSNAAMASPGVAVNQLSRSQHLDQLYYGVFKPKTTKRWPGNLKRYRLDASSSTVVDYKGAAAIDPATTYFSVNAKSWWSSGEDGNDATKGGASEMQTGPITVYTDDPGSNAMYVLNAASPPAGLSNESNVKWLQGYDVDNDNAQGETGFRQSIGAPMHAQPVMVSYGSSVNDYAVFIGTNDGLLHSINVTDGSQNWAWLPSDLQSNVALLRENASIGSGGSPIYGLDASWSMVSVAGKRLLVGGMRQGGSNYYALRLSATDKAAAPILQWAIRPTTSTAFARLGKTWSQPQLVYVRIGGAAKPVLVFGGGLDDAAYNSSSTAKATDTTSSNLGNAIYMVDALTGELVWWASSSATSSATATSVSSLKYSVPGGVRALDKNLDGYADHLYFGDIGGQMFRVDLDNTASAPKLVKRVALLAQLGGSEGSSDKKDDRRFYEMPAVVYAIDAEDKLFAAVTIGSGDRNFPRTNTATDDRFYMIRDYDAARFDILLNQDSSDPAKPWMDAAGTGYNGISNLVTKSAPLKTTDLADLSSTFGEDATTEAAENTGWFIDLPDSGEKVLSSPYIFSRQTSEGKLEYEINFNSFVPSSSSSRNCSPVAGATSVWKLLLSNAGPVSSLSGTGSNDSGDGADRNGDGVVDDKDRKESGVVTGITGSGVPVVVDKDGDGKPELTDLTGTKGQNSGDLFDGFGHIQRTRWYDKRGD
jgi:type IV pilus assembly protein PilY1